jgi:hypothetical protein
LLEIKCATLHHLVGTDRPPVRVLVGVHGHTNSYALAVMEQTVLRAFGATQVTVPVVQEAAGSPGGRQWSAEGGQGVATCRPKEKHVSAARERRRTDTHR